MAQNEISTSLFTGQLSYTIPIYTIDDPDFHFDIALRYMSEGFRPFQPSGCYGLNWEMIAGGSIRRVVQGNPDDTKNSYYHYSNTPKKRDIGMLYAIQDGNIPSKEDIYNFDNDVYNIRCGAQYLLEEWDTCAWNLDYMSDIYYFNFCSYKGRFIINNNGEARIVSGDFVDVDLSGVTTSFKGSYPSQSHTMPDSSQITITTIDGYQYIFGGSKKALEYTALAKKNDYFYQDVPAITAWYLTKIIAPNRRTLNLNYEAGTSAPYGANSLTSFITNYDWTEQNYEDTTHIFYSLHKECLLHSITTSDSVPLTISFRSHPESSRMYENDDFVTCTHHLQLDSIIVLHGYDTLKTANLSYQYSSYNRLFGAYPNYYWRRLQQVAISGVGKYSMTYNDINPDESNPFLLLVPHYPNLNPMNNTSFKNMVDRMGFWKVTSLQGLLKEVSFPTGGKIKFMYSNHEYGKERCFRVVNNQDVELYTQSNANMPLSGARIEKIETFSNTNTLVETQNFLYNRQGTTYSSGIFYNIYEIIYPSKRFPIANTENYGMIDSHIGYSYVEKETTIGSEKYKTAYTFDTGVENYSSAGNNFIHRNVNTSIYNDTTEICSGSLTYSEKLRITGKLMAVEQYKGNTLVKSTLLKYNGILNNQQGMLPNQEQSLGCTDTIVILSKYSGHTARKLFVCPDVLEKSVTYEYNGDNEPIVTNKTFIYDRKLRVTKETIDDSQGIHHFTRYTYPDNLSIPYPYPIFQLQRMNCIGHPIETFSGYIKDDIEYVTNGVVEEYKNINYIVHGGHRYHPYLYKTLSLALTEPITDYQPMSNSGHLITYDPHYKLDCEYHFDLQNRLTFIQPVGQLPTTYTWNGIYPVTKTTGNQTYTYTFIPHVGISSITDPRGITTYYSYDEHGRLVESYQLVNDHKQIINAYQYHVKTENL